MNSEHSCIGCKKPFMTLKRLRAHKALCKANKRLKTDIAQTYLRREKAKTEDHGHPKQPQVDVQHAPIPFPIHVEASGSNVFQIQAASPAVHDDNFTWSQDDAGPSGSRQDDVPEPNLSPQAVNPPIVSAHSG
ncbi:hypothetical protein OG21DRAFT_1486947 [Imleria badia]|nr:hypothetical protein OG21DRAFT_1486947 [Imleria badia]